MSEKTGSGWDCVKKAFADAGVKSKDIPAEAICTDQIESIARERGWILVSPEMYQSNKPAIIVFKSSEHAGQHAEFSNPASVLVDELSITGVSIKMILQKSSKKI